MVRIRIFLVIYLFNFCSHEEEITKSKIFYNNEKGEIKSDTRSTSNSFTLETLFANAIESTERLAIKKESITQAEARRDSYFSNFFPSLAFRYQQFVTTPNHAEHDRDIRNRNNLANAYSNTAYGTDISTPYNASNYLNSSAGNSSTVTSPLVRPGARLVLHIPILTGLNEYSLYKSSKHEVRLRNLELKHDAGRLYLEIAQTYYNLLQSESNLKTRKEILQLTISLRQEMKRRVQLGRNRNSELLSLNSQISRLEAEILGVTDTISQLKDTISYLTGLDSNFKIEKKIEISIHSNFDEIEKKIETRHDIQAAKINLEMAKSEVLKAYGGHLPTASVDTFYTFPSGHIAGGTKDLVNQFIVQVPLISLGTVSSAIKQAESLKHQMELQLTQTIRFAREEVRKAFNSYLHAISMEKSYTSALESTENSLNIIIRDYSKKSATELDLLNARIALITAKEDLNKTVLQKELNLVWLKVAIDEYPSSEELEKINNLFSISKENDK